jgi:nicotinamide riboside kinase
LAYVHCQDDLAGLASPITIWALDEARRIANGMTQRKDFHPSCTDQWKKSRSYHVALEDGYIRARGGFINTVCK